MYIVIFEEQDGYFGPFSTWDKGTDYIADVGLQGMVVPLVSPSGENEAHVKLSWCNCDDPLCPRVKGEVK